MDSHQFCSQESGPDEDHYTVTCSQLSKAVEPDCETYHWKSEILTVQRNSNIIDAFLNDVTTLVTLDGTYGLIWDENLQPSDGKYELGLHYCGTRESNRNSVHGTVSFFRDGMTGVKFAIKTLEENTYFHPEEIKVSLMNRHVNICSVYGIIVRKGQVEILLEHAGLPLTEERAWIAESPNRMLSLARQSFQALEILHQSGYVHSDIKPDNIMISKSGQDFTVKLIDFGSCQRLGAVLPQHAHTTPWYWSPEIWQALNLKKHVVCSFATDVYALALTLYFVQTAFHLIQLLKEEDIKDLMTKNPEHVLLIALPETIPLELRGVMRQCLDGNPETRLPAEKAVQQLTEDVMAPSENYKEKFERLFAILKNSSSSISPKTVFGENSFQFAPDQQNGLQHFVGGSKSVVENTRTKKPSSFGGTKHNRSISRSKKRARPPLKAKAAKKMTSDRSSSLIGLKGPQIEAVDGVEMSTDERTYSCSILLKNLALQVKPSETQSSDVGDTNMLCPAVTFEEMTTLSLKSSTGFRPTEVVQQPSQPEGSVKHMENFERRDSIWGYPRQLSMMPTSGAPDKVLSCETVSNVNQTQSFKTSLDKAAAKSNTEVYANQNITDGVPVATDIHMHASVDYMQPCSLETASMKPSTAPDDDVAFVIEAFGPGAFNGSEDDIVNNWLKMLEQDEQNDGSGPTNESVSSIKLNKLRGENLNTSQPREVESMDTDQTESSLSNQPVSSSNGIVLRAGMKRMSYSLETVTEIPNKTICPDSEQKLPNFDQILP